MSVGVLLVTHGRLSHMLLHTVEDVLGEVSLPTEILQVRRIQDPDALLRQGQRLIARLDEGDGVLILTDAFGSTPSNIANRIETESRTAAVSGVNLPMLMRIYNYPDLDLEALATAAIEGGQRGIIRCPQS